MQVVPAAEVALEIVLDRVGLDDPAGPQRDVDDHDLCIGAGVPDVGGWIDRVTSRSSVMASEALLISSRTKISLSV